MDVKQAVSIAKNYLQDLFPHSANGLQLEEVEYVPSNGSWLITLSYIKPEYSRLLGEVAPSSTGTRDYKVVHVTSDGKPLSIKMRRDVA